jgi:hypothetical protein
LKSLIETKIFYCLFLAKPSFKHTHAGQLFNFLTTGEAIITTKYYRHEKETAKIALTIPCIILICVPISVFLVLLLQKKQPSQA